MDNVSSSNTPPKEPVASDHGTGQPIRLEDSPVSGASNVSRAPLNLGGAAAPAPTSAPAPGAALTPKAPAPAPAPRPAPVKLAPAGMAGDRITACKTFFTKLHPGAMHFLDEQIAKWLKENPQVVIKHTNVIQGEITEKKVEQNIVIVVWY